MNRRSGRAGRILSALRRRAPFGIDLAYVPACATARPTLMLRITKINIRPGHVNLLLEGTVMLPWIDALCRECLKCSGPNTTVALDLGEIDFVDEHGITALRALMHLGVRLVNVPPIIDSLLSESTGD